MTSKNDSRLSGRLPAFHHPVTLGQSKKVDCPPPVCPVAKADDVREARREVVRRDSPEETSISVAAGTDHVCLADCHAARSMQASQTALL